MNPHNQLILEKAAKTIQQKKTVFSTNETETARHLHAKENDLKPSTKINPYGSKTQM